jgi:phosphoribosylamine--glycine ligase
LSPRKGDAIAVSAPQGKDGMIFHAGTSMVNGQLQTSGGRVLCATALGHDVAQAQSKAYELVEQVAFDGMQYRTDIGYKAIAGVS